MSSKTLRLSASQEALDQILTANGKLAEKIRAAFPDRSMLHGYRTGRRKPRVEEASRLHELTAGDVSATGWSTTREETIEVDSRAHQATGTDGDG